MDANKGVNADDLDWDDDMRLLDDTPYSGPAFLVYPDGSRQGEMFYQDGFLEGTCREWHPNGNLKREWYANRGRTHGTERKWFADGKLNMVGKYEFGIMLQYDEWDESGKLIAHRQIDEKSSLFKYLQQLREQNG